MSAAVSILDYGIGNLKSVRRAFEAIGVAGTLIETPAEVIAAERLVLPGVGAFGRCAEVLSERGLTDAVLQYFQLERPFLGICVGMQLMHDVSMEFGTHTGFGLIPGRVDTIPATGIDGRLHKIPHIGWSRLQRSEASTAWSGTLLHGIAEGSYVYFVHSYTSYPLDPTHRLADTHYDGRQIAAVVTDGIRYGVQFHPEKSGAVGLAMLRNFLTC